MKKIEIGIVGGGLAGLTAAIHLAAKGLAVSLFEKETFPHHRVCGEYLSNEVLPYLESLNISLGALNPAKINRLEYSTAAGNSLASTLELGGVGISRYALDNYLFKKALDMGVEIMQETVTDISFGNESFHITSSSGNEFKAKLVLGAYGKRSILDKKLNRKFSNKKTGWLAVKAHYINSSHPPDVVGLHNFEGGYCGISKTETSAVNVCYLATYKSFKNYKDPELFKEKVLMRNPKLKSFFEGSEACFEEDLSIAQVSFRRKATVENHILMIGDSAGLIHPLCGNGMAMAIHSAKIASEAILKFSKANAYDLLAIEREYCSRWNKEFKNRLAIGRLLQKIFLNENLSEFCQYLIKTFPGILPEIIRNTHGKPLV